MLRLLDAARSAAWERETQSLSGRWLSAFRAAHDHIAHEWKIGGLIFPHTLRRYMERIEIP